MTPALLDLNYALTPPKPEPLAVPQTGLISLRRGSCCSHCLEPSLTPPSNGGSVREASLHLPVTPQVPVQTFSLIGHSSPTSSPAGGCPWLCQVPLIEGTVCVLSVSPESCVSRCWDCPLRGLTNGFWRRAGSGRQGCGPKGH